MSGWIAIISAVLGAAVVICGNHYLQRGVVRRHRSADDLKNRLYEFLDLAVRYWTAAGSEPPGRRWKPVRHGPSSRPGHPRHEARGVDRQQACDTLKEPNTLSQLATECPRQRR